MYVCVCHAVTDGHIRECASDGACKMRELRERLGLASSCGKCAAHALEVLREASMPGQAAVGSAGCC
jgi:bacterioferritin-associated ferredoxin